MKKFSKIIHDNKAIIEHATNNGDMLRFYCIDRITRLYESGELNPILEKVLQNSGDDIELKIQEVAQKYLNDIAHFDNEEILNKIDTFSESKVEHQKRFDLKFKSLTESMHGYNQSVVNGLMVECYGINPILLIEHLHDYGVKIGKMIDVQNTLSESVVKNNFEDTELPDNPKEILSITESLMNSVNYLLSYDKYSPGIKNLITLRESLTNIYNVYHEGIEVIESQENNALEYFNLFVNGGYKMYDFQVQHLIKTLKNPATFCNIGLHWLHEWVLNNQQRLSYKFIGNEFIRLESMINIMDRQHPVFISEKPVNNFNILRMFELLDILLSVSQLLRMDLRQLVIAYINLVRQMLNSYRDDLHFQGQRSR